MEIMAGGLLSVDDTMAKLNKASTLSRFHTGGDHALPKRIDGCLMDPCTALAECYTEAVEDTGIPGHVPITIGIQLA